MSCSRTASSSVLYEHTVVTISSAKVCEICEAGRFSSPSGKYEFLRSMGGGPLTGGRSSQYPSWKTPCAHSFVMVSRVTIRSLLELEPRHSRRGGQAALLFPFWASLTAWTNVPSRLSTTLTYLQFFASNSTFFSAFCIKLKVGGNCWCFMFCLSSTLSIRTYNGRPVPFNFPFNVINLLSLQ